MQSLKIGHYTSLERGTGLSVFLFESPAVGAYQICGSSPATRELSTLDLEANVMEINGLVLTGGSAFGLGAVDGVMQFLREKGLGKLMPHGGVVPIVPAAAIYDLAVKSPDAFPTAENAYEACLNAKENNLSAGPIGAGTGASIGKLVPGATRMSGGLGCAQLELAGGLIVRAYAVVNAVGDVRDTEGHILAGAKLANGEFGDCQAFLLGGGIEAALPPQSNTTLVAVFTNGAFSKIELKRIAKMAIAGMARAISPAFTRYDGDIVFCVSVGEHVASELTIGALAAEVVQKAIINAVSHSTIIEKN
jgi:L-aminopeptidase/D-esterase-like protein